MTLHALRREMGVDFHQLLSGHVNASSMSEYNTCMLWLANGNVPLDESRQPESVTATSHHVNQPVRHQLSSLSVPTVTTRGFSRVAAANYCACTTCVYLPPCIVGTAPSLESHERVEFVRSFRETVMSPFLIRNQLKRCANCKQFSLSHWMAAAYFMLSV